jgi:hypothetical protein
MFHSTEKRESISLHHLNSWRLSKSALLIWVKCLCMSEESFISEVHILNLDRNNTMMEPPHWTRTWIATIFGRLLSALDLNYCNYNQNIPETMQHIAKSTFKITNGMGQEHKVAWGQERDMIISRWDWLWHKCTAILSFDWHIFGTQYRIHKLMWNSWCHVPVLELALRSATLTKTRSEPQYHPHRLGQNQNSEIISVITDMFQKHIMLKLMGFWFCTNSQTIQTCQPRTSVKFFHLHLVYLFASLSVHVLFINQDYSSDMGDTPALLGSLLSDLLHQLSQPLQPELLPPQPPLVTSQLQIHENTKLICQDSIFMKLQRNLHNNNLKVPCNECSCNLMRATHKVSDHHHLHHK